MARQMRAPPTKPGKFRFPFRETAVIVLAAVLVYLPALRGDFVFDDWILLVQQPLIHAADGLWRIWFTTEARECYPVLPVWLSGRHTNRFADVSYASTACSESLRRLGGYPAWI